MVQLEILTKSNPDYKGMERKRLLKNKMDRKFD